MLKLLNKIIWRIRYRTFIILHTAAMFVLPSGRYKTELNSALWSLGLKVQVNYMASKAKETGATDVV
jgi:hypothetical protein